MPVDQIKKRFIASYAIALSLIILISIAAHTITLHAIRQESGAAEIVNISGKQRMLSQRLWALVEVQSGDRSALSNIRPIVVTIEELDSAHRRLLTYVSNLPSGALKDELVDLYSSEGSGITPLLEDHIQIARRAVETPVSVAERERMQALALGELIAPLDRAVSLFELRAEQGLSRIALIQIVQIASIVLILLLEALFIFAPLMRQTLDALTSEQEARGVIEDALKFQTEAMSSKNRFLQMMSKTFLQPLAYAQEKMEAAVTAPADEAPAHVKQGLMALKHVSDRAEALMHSYGEAMEEIEEGAIKADA